MEHEWANERRWPGPTWSLAWSRVRDKRWLAAILALVPVRVRVLMPVLVLVLLPVLAGRPVAGQAVPPDEAWQTLETAHFRVHVPASLEPLGRRTALIAERARARLAEAFIESAPGRIDLVLTDHADVSNGFAAVAPRRRIVIYARPPVDGGPLSYYDDWLDLVVVHELAHIVHLDRVGGPGKILRGVLGRVPATWPFFPGLAAPRWVVEGLATWYESALTDAGRIRGSTFPMYLRTSALAGGFEDLDQASGESPVWPDGQRPYLYGSHFFAWLLERHGAERMAVFVDAVAGQWVPYRLNAAARTAFGESFSDAWRLWAAAVEADATAVAATVRARSRLPEPEVLTLGARQGLHPRVSPDGRILAYARNNGRSDSRIVLRGVADGREVGSLRTNAGATFSWLPDGGLLYEQFELDGPWRFRTDLFVRSPEGEVRRLTHAARLDQPAAAPDGRWAAAIRTRDGHTELVRVDLTDGSVGVVGEGADSVHWAFPAVSPDGRWIAASRWRPGALYEVVVVSAATGAVAVRLDGVRSLDLAPAWSPDGRWLVWASDRSGISNLYAAEIDLASGTAGPLRQVTDVVTGVAFPSVSAEGRWVYHSLYTAEGWEVARVPFDPAAWTDARADPVPAQEAAMGAATRFEPAALEEPTLRPYRSAASFRPRYWEPVLLSEVSSGGTTVMGPFVGAQTVITDIVERHSLAVSAAVAVDRGRADASARYTWAGWGNPLFSLTASQGYDAGGPFAVGDGARVFIEERERRAAASLTLLRPRWRSNVTLTGSAGIVQEDRVLLDATDLEPSRDFRLTRPSSRLGDLRVSASMSTVRPYALSISPERGMSLFVQARTRPQLQLVDSLSGVVGSDRSLDEVIGRATAYWSFRGWGWANHVLALRVAGGRAAGPGADAFWFDVGGASGREETVTGLGLFGGRALFFPVRGFDGGDRSGTRAWTGSAEWRFPIWWINAGWGLVPLHLDRLHGALFVDAGNAWGPVLPVPGYDNPRRGEIAAAGMELRLEALTFFTVPLDLRLGVAAPLAGGTGARVFFRLGSSF